MITAISPIDGRYASKVEALSECFSEYALVRNLVKVEVLWLLALCAEPKISECRALTIEEKQHLRAIVSKFTPEEAEKVKDIEKVTNHDVKAVEYYLKDQITGTSLEGLSEFLHFACTSEDINNLSHAMMLKDGLKVLEPLQERIASELTSLANEFKTVPMLARTHGQTASPTTIGKELAVFVARLRKQGASIAAVDILGKLNGAVGNFNAHLSAYPQVDWVALSKQVIEGELGLNVEFVPGDWRHGVDPAEVAARLCADKAHEIKAVMVVHNETSTGVTSRIGEIRNAIDSCAHPALFMVDVISSLGSIDYRHDEWAVDVTVGGSQKGLMLPPGLGFNAISGRALEAAKTATLPASYWSWQPITTRCAPPLRPGSERYGLYRSHPWLPFPLFLLLLQSASQTYGPLGHQTHCANHRQTTRSRCPRNPLCRPNSQQPSGF